MSARHNPIPPPHNLDAEKQVLGAILIDPVLPDVLGIFSVRGDVIDIVTVSNELTQRGELERLLLEARP